MEDYDRWKDDPGESCDRKEKSGPIYGSEKAVVYKKKKTGSIVSYELIDKNDKPIVTIYPLMKDSSTLMERLKRLKYPVEEA